MPLGIWKRIGKLTLLVLLCMLGCDSHARSLGFVFPQQSQKDVNVVRGRVTDRLSREPMTGVTIVVEGTAQGVVTDKDGRYTLTLPGEQATLLFSL